MPAPVSKQWLAATQEGFSNQDLPFDMLAAALFKEKQVCLEPQVMFLFDDTREPPLQLHDLSVARAHRQKKGHDVIPTTFDLIVQAEVESNCLATTFLYDRNVFSAEAVDHIAKAWRGLLKDVSSAPQRRLRELLTVPTASEATDNNGRVH